MSGSCSSVGLSCRINEVLVLEESEKRRVFSEFLDECDFSGSPQEEIVLDKLNTLSQCMFKLRNYESKSQSLHNISTSCRSGLSNQIHASNCLKYVVKDLEALLPRLSSVCESMKRLSELPQLLREVKAAEVDILSDAVKSFNSVPSLSPNLVPHTLPDFYDPVKMERLRLDTSLLREQVRQLEEKITHFGGLDTDPEVATSDVISVETELIQLQKGNGFARGLSGWK